MILPVQAALERVPVIADRGLRRSRRQARARRSAHVILPLALPGVVAGVDLHLLADARRLHRAADRRPVVAHPRARSSTRSRARPETSRSPRPSPSCRSSSWACSSTSPSARGRSMRSERERRERTAPSARLEGRGRPRACCSCTCRSLFILLYAFTNEDRSFQFPPPGFTLRWFGVAWSRPDIWNALRSRSRRGARIDGAGAVVLGTLARGCARAGAILRPRGDLAALHAADRPARHRDRHLAPLRPSTSPTSPSRSGRSCSATRRSASSSSTTTPSRASVACRRRWSKRRWTSAPTASRPSATSCCRPSHRAARRRHARLRAVLRRGDRHHLHGGPAADAADLDAVRTDPAASAAGHQCRRGRRHRR